MPLDREVISPLAWHSVVISSILTAIEVDHARRFCGCDARIRGNPGSSTEVEFLCSTPDRARQQAANFQLAVADARQRTRLIANFSQQIEDQVSTYVSQATGL